MFIHHSIVEITGFHADVVLNRTKNTYSQNYLETWDISVLEYEESPSFSSVELTNDLNGSVKTTR